MQVILLQDVKKLGQRGSVVQVADGYAMNVLIPKKQAIPATQGNIQRVEKEALAAAGKKEMDAVLAKKALQEINGKTVTISVKANEAGGLFESIHEKHIGAAVLKATGISLPESAFKLSEPIKKTGTYEVQVSIHNEKAKITLTISS